MAVEFPSSKPLPIKRDGVLARPSPRGVLMASVGCILVLSLIMVASASIPFAVSHGINELFFFQHQLAYILIGVVAATLTYYIPLKLFYNLSYQFLMLVVTGLLLVLTLYGDEVNGSTRWLELGSVNFQTAELAKLVMVLFVSDFVVRRSYDVRQGWNGFLRILTVVVILTILLLMQPDFGSLVMIIGTTLAIFYVAGTPHRQFFTLGAMAVILSGVAIWLKDYRMSRLTSFLDPFNDIKDSDYQLARSLIAFGRGEWTGVGYGQSVQKLAHLPEAHTDFLLAITAEELGLVGVVTILLLEALVIASAMRISYVALQNRQMRLSYTAFGFGVIFIGQTLINAGMNMGLMPTKGLTLPFFSYGGSSLVISLVMVGLLLSIDKNSSKIPASDCRYF